jgi:hypothetical protein
MNERLKAKLITFFIGIAVMLVFFPINYLIYSNDYFYKIYAAVRDVFVLGVASITLYCSFMSYRKETNDRYKVFYYLIINFIIIISTLHILRIIYGGLLCQKSHYY